MRDDPVARRGDVVAARRRQRAHHGDHRLFALILKIADDFVNVIRRQHFAAGGVDAEQHRLHVVVFARPFELPPDRLDHVVPAGIDAETGDQAGEIDYSNLVFAVAVSNGGFLDIAVAAGAKRHAGGADGQHDNQEAAQQQATQQAQGEPHPAPAFPGRCRTWPG